MCSHRFTSWGKPQLFVGTAEEIAKTRQPSDWRRLSAGAGTKGPRLHDWCYLELADLDGDEDESQGLWTRGLLIRRHIGNGDLAYFTTWCPAQTSIQRLVSVEGHRWAIEDSFETAKNEFGLDHNETRSWHGWHRHVSFVMLAFAMMAAIQHQANKPVLKKNKSNATPGRPTSSWSIQEIRRIAQRLERTRIRPATVIAWSPWRRAHQAAARQSHLKRKSQL
jgi:SRSO17 transposase